MSIELHPWFTQFLPKSTHSVSGWWCTRLWKVEQRKLFGNGFWNRSRFKRQRGTWREGDTGTTLSLRKGLPIWGESLFPTTTRLTWFKRLEVTHPIVAGRGRAWWREIKFSITNTALLMRSYVLFSSSSAVVQPDFIRIKRVEGV